MKAVLAIPGAETLRNYGDASEVLMRKVAGVPLLVRAIATAARAGVDSVLIVWPENVNPAILASCLESPLINKVRVEKLVWARAFDPETAAHWALSTHLEDAFLWLPWNWVTHKRTITALLPSSVLPVTWQRPVLLEKDAALLDPGFRASSTRPKEGVLVSSAMTVGVAEQFLVVHSGKPTDGIYSNFNRWLCRPVVRLLSHTRVTPNAITLFGLLVALVAAFMFARGTYL